MKFSVEDALKYRVVMLGGPETALRLEALNALLSEASEGDEFAIENFSGDTSKPLDWIAAASTSPFMTTRRISVVRSLLRNEDSSQLVGDLPETALIILVADDEGSEDVDKARKLGRNQTAWAKAVEAIGGKVYNFTVDPKEIVQVLRAEASKEGKDLTNNAAHLLKDMCGESLSVAKDELIKVILFSDQRTRITEDDVRAVVMPSKECSVFDLIDRVIAGDAGGSLSQLAILLGNKRKAEAAAFQNLFPMLARAFRLMFQARSILDAGGSFSEIPKTVKDSLPERGNILAERDWARKKAFQQASHASLDAISRCLTVLSHTDARLKGQEASFSTADTLETMILELVRELRPVPEKSFMR